MAPKPCLEKLDFIFILNTEEDGSLAGHVYAAAPVLEKYFVFTDCRQTCSKKQENMQSLSPAAGYGRSFCSAVGRHVS